MKIVFRIKDNKLQCNNVNELNNFIINIDVLNSALELRKITNMDVFSLLPSKVVYIINNGGGNELSVKPAFVIRDTEKNKIYLFDNSCVLDIQNGDFIFTTKKEAEEILPELKKASDVKIPNITKEAIDCMFNDFDDIIEVVFAKKGFPVDGSFQDFLKILSESLDELEQELTNKLTSVVTLKAFVSSISK